MLIFKDTFLGESNGYVSVISYNNLFVIT